MRILLTTGLLVSASILCFTPAILQAQAYNYLPLVPGMAWHYEAATGESWLTTVKGEQMVLGRITTTLVHSIDQVVTTQVVHNFWTVDMGGDLYLHGAHNITTDFVVSYEPPILWLDAPLELDKTWSTSFQPFFSLDGTNPGNPGVNHLQVFESADLTVPYGTFPAFGIGYAGTQKLTAPDGRAYDLLGFTQEVGGLPTSKGAFSWFSDGLGRLQEIYEGATYQLVTWNGPVPVMAETWGGLKNLYRQ
jgi:hypothetical protein